MNTLLKTMNMKKIVLALVCIAGAAFFSSCGFGGGNSEEGDVPSDVTIDEMNESGYAIKIAYTSVSGSDNGYFVYTRKGKMYRWDTVIGDRAYAYYYDRGTETGHEYYKGTGEEGEWEEANYYTTQQSLNNLYAEWVSDCSSLLSKYGFAKTGSTKILGKNCDVWTGTYSKEGKAFGAVAYGEMTQEGNSGEFCVWNGLCLRSKVNGKLQTEATAIVVNVPDEAFTETNEISWIK